VKTYFRKTKLAAALSAFTFFAVVSTSAQAAFIVDTKIGESLLNNSSDAAELAAMKGFANDNSLIQDLEMDFTAFVNAPGQWYLDVAPTGPGYFLLKFGIGGTSATANTFFFQNIGEMTKLVWSDSQVQFLSGGGGRNTNIGRLNHYTAYDPSTPSAEIPEPGTLALLGLGLAAFSIRRKRKQ
jgi:hypothetical protein